MHVCVQANSAEFNASYNVTQLQNQTYDNSGSSQPHTFTYASEFAQVGTRRPSQVCPQPLLLVALPCNPGT